MSYVENVSFLFNGNRIAGAPILSFLVGPSEIQNPSGCATFEDAPYNVNPLDLHSAPITGHGNRIAMLFLDGHTKEIPFDLTTGHCDGPIPTSPRR
jgi:prepilin-type processing-associated H-X9-DG protein